MQRPDEYEELMTLDFGEARFKKMFKLHWETGLRLSESFSGVINGRVRCKKLTMINIRLIVFSCREESIATSCFFCLSTNTIDVERSSVNDSPPPLDSWLITR